jgi:hypothetical protein
MTRPTAAPISHQAVSMTCVPFMPTICSALMLVSSSEPAMKGQVRVPPARKTSREASVEGTSWRQRHQVSSAMAAVRPMKMLHWMTPAPIRFPRTEVRER